MGKKIKKSLVSRNQKDEEDVSLMKKAAVALEKSEGANEIGVIDAFAL